MQQSRALAGFAALSQETRLQIVRLLVRAGPEGLAAGAIAEAVGVSPSNMSFHLKELEHAGLLAARRAARSIIYTADYAVLRGLIEFLMKDCCGGRPEICAPALGKSDLAPTTRKGRVMSEHAYNVLFLCTGNSARSIIAEAVMNKLGAGRFHGYSAGSQPKGEINPNTIQLLQRLDFDTSGFRSKSWEEFTKPGAPEFDFIFTVCDNAAGEACPVWPGQPMTAHWGIPDPAEAKGTAAEIAVAFAEAYRMLSQRIGIFAALPIAKLDELTLQSRLREIGRMEGATSEAETT